MQISLMTQCYTLVIVDMQTGFPASQDKRTIEGVMAEIRQAKACNASIIFIESDPGQYGKIDERLLSLVRDYNSDLWTLERKAYRCDLYWSASSGGLQVAEACEVFEFPTNRFRICGVHTHICVFFTAMELNRILPHAQLEIVARACNDGYADSPAEAQRLFEHYAPVHNFSSFRFDLGD
jgi:hypothetical protein